MNVINIGRFANGYFSTFGFPIFYSLLTKSVISRLSDWETTF